jgi:hypothetical protein
MSDNIKMELNIEINKNECYYCKGKCINDCMKKIINLICPRCNITFTTVSNLNKHLKKKKICAIREIDINTIKNPIINTEPISDNLQYINKIKELEKIIEDNENIKKNLISDNLKMIKEIENLKKNNINFIEGKIDFFLSSTFNIEDIKIICMKLINETDDNKITDMQNKLRKYRKEVQDFLDNEILNIKNHYTKIDKNELYCKIENIINFEKIICKIYMNKDNIVLDKYQKIVSDNTIKITSLKKIKKDIDI